MPLGSAPGAQPSGSNGYHHHDGRKSGGDAGALNGLSALQAAMLAQALNPALFMHANPLLQLGLTSPAVLAALSMAVPQQQQEHGGAGFPPQHGMPDHAGGMSSSAPLPGGINPALLDPQLAAALQQQLIIGNGGGFDGAYGGGAGGMHNGNGHMQQQQQHLHHPHIQHTRHHASQQHQQQHCNQHRHHALKDSLSSGLSSGLSSNGLGSGGSSSGMVPSVGGGGGHNGNATCLVQHPSTLLRQISGGGGSLSAVAIAPLDGNAPGASLNDPSALLSHASSRLSSSPGSTPPLPHAPLRSSGNSIDSGWLSAALRNAGGGDAANIGSGRGLGGAGTPGLEAPSAGALHNPLVDYGRGSTGTRAVDWSVGASATGSPFGSLLAPL